MSSRTLLLGISVVLNILLAWALVWGDNGLMSYRSLREESLALDGRIRDLNSRNLELSREIRLLQSDKKFIEQTIRKRLNFVRENEILYIFPGDTEAQRAGVINEPEN